MKKAILLVQSHEDAKLLPAAGRVVARLGIEQLWLLCSQAITVTEAGLALATAAEDKDLEALGVAEAKAVALKDYKSAEEYKAKADRVMVEKKNKIRNEWKRILPEDRQKEFRRIVMTFLKEANPENKPNFPGWLPSLASEHFPKEDFVEFLNQNKANCPKNLLPWGSFAVLWPAQLVELENAFLLPTWDVMKSHRKDTASLAVAKVPVPIIKVTDPGVAPAMNRRQELEGLRHFALAAVAKKLKVAHEKRPKAEIISDILAAEFAASEASV